MEDPNYWVNVLEINIYQRFQQIILRKDLMWCLDHKLFPLFFPPSAISKFKRGFDSQAERPKNQVAEQSTQATHSHTSAQKRPSEIAGPSTLQNIDGIG
jgi:hypothetical protein